MKRVAVLSDAVHFPRFAVLATIVSTSRGLFDLVRQIAEATCERVYVVEVLGFVRARAESLGQMVMRSGNKFTHFFELLICKKATFYGRP